MELKTTFNGHESKFIQQIVQDISLKLRFINLNVDRKLVGMEARVKNVVSSLENGSDDVRMIGIKGIGGGGKTTLARAVFDHLSIWFEGKSFVENVREVSKGSSAGLIKLQKQILKGVLNDQTIDVESVSDGKILMEKLMCGQKVLVVLDDVDDTEQLEALAGELTWFKPGSRIIITTRDQQVLVAYGVNFIHDVNLLSYEEAICLFSKYAFKREIPNRGYEELSRDVVHYAAGLPLTIKVLGSHLCGRSKREWVDSIERLKTIPLDKTLKRLEISYNALENDQKEIFLDVVCILKDEKKDDAIRILESCGFNAEIGLRVLEQKSLITFSYQRLGFHDHIEEMGKDIIRRLHPNEPNKHSRLWINEEIKDIFVNESGTEATKCINLKNTYLHPAIIMKGLKKMKGLRLLYMHDVLREWNVEVSQYVPYALRTLCLPKYTSMSLPETLRANKLGFWEWRERKVYDKLRYLDFSGSRLKTFDLSMTPHLETLDFAGCLDFVELHMPCECPKLKFLNLSHSKVSNLNLGMTPYLEELNLQECCYLQEIHAPVGCLKKLVYLNFNSRDNLRFSGCSRFDNFLIDKREVLHGLDSLAKLELNALPLDICPLHPKSNLPKFKFKCDYDEPLPSSSGNLEKLLSFGICACTNLESFSASISGLQNLRELTLKGSIPEVPKDLGQIQSLEKLCFLWMEKIKHLPGSICMLKHLKYLELKSCWLMEQLPRDLHRLECLEEFHLTDCRSLRDIPNSICKVKSLTYLNLSQCDQIKKLPEEIGYLECLEKLDLRHCRSLREIPNNICKMKSLAYLNLSGCHKIEKLPEELGCLERIEELHLSGCEALRDIPDNICKMKSLTNLELSGCYQVEKLPEELGCLECLEKLNLTSCESLRGIPNSICKIKSLTYLNVSCCHRVEKLPTELGRLECLEELDLKECKSLQDLPNSICKMKSLTSLCLSYCHKVEKLPEEIGSLECLETLFLTDCISLRDIPNSICKMKSLTHLDLSGCNQVEKLPDELGRLECLEKLHLMGCRSLQDIPNDICKLKKLTYLNLRYCHKVKKLPEELGCLKRLKELDLTGTSISHLPQSLYHLKGLSIYWVVGILRDDM